MLETLQVLPPWGTGEFNQTGPVGGAQSLGDACVWVSDSVGICLMPVKIRFLIKTFYCVYLLCFVGVRVSWYIV